MGFNEVLAYTLVLYMRCAFSCSIVIAESIDCIDHMQLNMRMHLCMRKNMKYIIHTYVCIYTPLGPPNFNFGGASSLCIENYDTFTQCKKFQICVVLLDSAIRRN